ncbi:MAG: sialidase family protein [Candidatus Promineifilaceae bacterium]|nr:sialidase family protein [Candidatus Promineifilaceae bacterium]
MLFETRGRASEAEVVSDREGTVHVFWSAQPPDDSVGSRIDSIYTVRLADGLWSSAVDILVSPEGRVARNHSVAVDNDGYLHIAWSGGNAIYYSQAHVSRSLDPSAWTEPYLLSGGQNHLEPDIAVGNAGQVYVVWTQSGSGLRLAISGDGGRSWDGPRTIFEAPGGSELARWGRLSVDAAGRLHVGLTHVVSNSSEEGPSELNHLYYLRSDDGGLSWTSPFRVETEPDYGELNLTTFGDTVHLVYNGRAYLEGRYHRWSSDGGVTWSPAETIVAPDSGESAGQGGLNGFPALVVDRQGTLHVVASADAGVFYLYLQNGNWSQPELISPAIAGTGLTGRTRSLEQPAVALASGNMLQAVFHDGFERIWYTSGTLDLAEEPEAAYVPEDVAGESVEPTVTQAPVLGEASPTTVPSTLLAGEPPAQETFSPLLFGILMAFVLLAIVVLGSRRGRTR